MDGGIKIPGEGRSQGPAGVRTMVILDIELKARRNIHFRSSAADNERIQHVCIDHIEGKTSLAS